MQAYAGTTYIELGGQDRPLKFGTNQTAKFCELRGIDLNTYGSLLSSGLEDMSVIRDLIFSALWAGAKSEKKPTDFDSFDVGDWMDEAGLEAVMSKFTEALNGIANPNEKAQEKAPKLARA